MKKRTSKKPTKSLESLKNNRRISKQSKPISVIDAPEETSLTLQEKYEQSLKNKTKISLIDEPILRQLGYDIREVINHGTYSTYKRILVSDEEYVVRITEKSMIPDIHLQYYRNELRIVRELSHRNIVSYVQGIETMYKIYVISRLESNGSLKDLLRKMSYLPEELCKRFFTDILTAVHFCHSRNLAHSNINSKTLCISNAYVIKLSNFKLAQKFRSIERSESKKFFGNYHYTAPEVLMCEAYNPFLADVWSVGVVFYEMLTGRLPFHGLKDEDLTYDLPPALNISSQSVDTLANIFLPSYERISLEELINTAWVENRITSNAEGKEKVSKFKRFTDSSSRILRRY